MASFFYMENFVTYILLSSKHNKTYVGFTSDLINRIKSHNQFDKKGYTAKFRPWVVVHVEFFETKSEAIKRENWFKSGVGRDYINNHFR